MTFKYFSKEKRVLVHLHLYYHNQLDFMISKLKNICGCSFDLYVTVCENNPKSEEKLRKFKPDVKIIRVENIGYDVYPFIRVLRMVDYKSYDYVLKLHTKIDHTLCRKLIEPLLNSKKQFIKILNTADTKSDAGMICSKYCLRYYAGDIPEESYMLNIMMKRLGLHYVGGQYLAGKIFFSRMCVFDKIINSDITEADFTRQAQTDTTAQVLERIFTLIVRACGFKVYTESTFNLKLRNQLNKMCSFEVIDTGLNKSIVIKFLMKKCIIRFPAETKKTDGTIQITREFNVSDNDKKRMAVFAAYCPNGTISEAQIYYLKGLKRVVDNIIFIADSLILPDETDKIKDLVCYCSFNRHGCYDFGSYKEGFDYASKRNLLENTEELILCNDSCYAPVFPFEESFSQMEAKDYDFWGYTSHSNPRRRQKKHLQSYFLVFRKNVFSSKQFKKFIYGVKKQHKVKDVINKYEIPFTGYLTKYGFSSAVFVSDSEKFEQYINKTLYPLTLLRDYRMPLIKVKVFNNKFLNTIKDDSFETLDYIKSVNPELARIIEKENSM